MLEKGQPRAQSDGVRAQDPGGTEGSRPMWKGGAEALGWLTRALVPVQEQFHSPGQLGTFRPLAASGGRRGRRRLIREMHIVGDPQVRLSSLAFLLL